MKAFTFVLKQKGNEFLSFLKEQGLLEILVKELYDQGTKYSKEQPVPVEWAEMKVANMRHSSIEKLISLVPDNSGISVKVVNKNYI